MRLAYFIKGELWDISENILIDYSMDFAVFIVITCDTIKRRASLTNQLMRNATCIDANIHAANYAQSKAVFASKLQTALKEYYESKYWLELYFRDP